MAIRTAEHPLADLSDDELAERFQGGDEAAVTVLVSRYRRLARTKARGYFLAGADADDVEQEGLIGLYKAARDFRPAHQASFRGFAEICVTRQVLTAVKSATRNKHRPLNQYVSISAGAAGRDGAGYAADDLLAGHHAPDPAERVVSDEAIAHLRARMDHALSPLEVGVLSLYLDGRSYEEIGRHLGRHPKSIDNALQRIKRKLDGLGAIITGTGSAPAARPRLLRRATRRRATPALA
ncbi:MAG: RNA polymerase sporulation sigma factor SigH [Acidimicrobiales bacterium]